MELQPITEEGLEDMKGVQYQNAVRSLMHAILGTRSDIAATVGVVSQFMSNPGHLHWTAVKIL